MHIMCMSYIVQMSVYHYTHASMYYIHLFIHTNRSTYNTVEGL